MMEFTVHWAPAMQCMSCFFFQDFLLFIYFYCILGFWVHVKNKQVNCIGSHLAVWFAAFLPFTYIWHFSPSSLSPTPHPRCPSPVPPNRPQCLVLPVLCSCVLIVQHPPVSGNMRYFIFCSCVSLLRMTVSRFLHVPTKDTNSSLCLLFKTKSRNFFFKNRKCGDMSYSQLRMKWLGMFGS